MRILARSGGGVRASRSELVRLRHRGGRAARLHEPNTWWRREHAGISHARTHTHTHTALAQESVMAHVRSSGPASAGAGHPGAGGSSPSVALRCWRDARSRALPGPPPSSRPGTEEGGDRNEVATAGRSVHSVSSGRRRERVRVRSRPSGPRHQRELRQPPRQATSQP